MTRCLECGFLYPAWDKEQEREYTEAERGKLRAGNDEPCGLGCFRGATGFPGNPARRVLIGSVGRGGTPSVEDKRRKQQQEEEDAKVFAALETDWNCELFALHIPGLKPSEHLDLQQSREWEAKQEQSRRAWERRQLEKNQRFQENLTDRQEKFETDQRRRDRHIAVIAWVIPLLVSTLVSLIITILTQDLQIGSQSQSTATVPSSPPMTATVMPTPTLSLLP